MAGGKLGAAIAEVDHFILDMYDHIYFFIAIDLAERESDRYLLVPDRNQGWTNVINRLRRIICW